MTAIAAPSKAQRIANLFLTGHALDDIAAKGLNGGWTRLEALEVVKGNGWDLDPSGRIPREQRTPPSPSQPTRALTAVPPQAADGAARMIADGKAHSVARVRRAAERAEKALDDLRDALKAEDGREKIRRRIAELEEEARRLKAQLGGTPSAAKRGSTPSTPINHGTWGGWMAEKNRGLDHCADCLVAKDETMAARRAAKAARQ